MLLQQQGFSFRTSGPQDINNTYKDGVQDVVYQPLRVGYYEVESSADRLCLRQLAANGLINYTVDVIRDEDQRPYYFVTVSLTKDGEKITEDKFPETEFDNDLREVVDSTAYAEKDVPEKDVTEMTPQEKANYEKREAEKLAEEKRVADEKLKAEQEKARLAALDRNAVQGRKSAYPAAKAREDFSTVFMKAYVRKAIIAKDILIKLDEKDIVTATARVIFETQDVTPAGRIYFKAIEKARTEENVALDYKEDKGWVLSNEEEIIAKAFELQKLYNSADADGNTYMPDMNEEVANDTIEVDDDYADTESYGTYDLQGNIGGSPVHMHMEVDTEGTVSGTYYYDRFYTPSRPDKLITLSGSMNSNGGFELVESSGKGVNHIYITMTGEDSYGGTYIRHDGKEFSVELSR